MGRDLVNNIARADADGQLSQCFSAVTDITVEKQSKALKDSEKKCGQLIENRQEGLLVNLSYNGEYLRVFVENSPLSMALFDSGMHYLAFSNRWLQDFHLTGQQFLGRSHWTAPHNGF